MKLSLAMLRMAVLIVVGSGMMLSQIGASHASTPIADQSPQGVETVTPGGACGAVATPGGMSGNMHNMPGNGMMSAMDFDLAFIYLMIPHHEGAIAMANVALERAEHVEIHALARDVIASQGAEIDQLRAWRAEWYPDAPEILNAQTMPMERIDQIMDGMDWQGMMAMNPAMEAASLCSTTKPFDLAFINMMIPHHEGAIMMAEFALQHALHPELKTFANDIIEVQRHEVDKMREWRATWFPDLNWATPAASSDPALVDVSLDEFSVGTSVTAFHIGKEYRFVATNHGALPHELMILPTMPGIGQRDMEELHHQALGVISVDDLIPGSVKGVEVTFTKPGTFELVCALPGHYDAGMTVSINVVA